MSQDRQKKQDAYAQMGDDYLSPVFDWVMGDIENEIYLGILQPWNETMEDVHLLNNGIRQNCPPEALFHVDPFTGASLHSSLATFDFAANFFKLPETRGGAALFAIPVAKTAFTGLKAVGKGAANAFKKVPIFDIGNSTKNHFMGYAKPDKSWKLKLHGNPQITGGRIPDREHAFISLKEAIAAAKNPNVTYVQMDLGINRMLPKELHFKPKGNIRPDVGYKTKDAKVHTTEVPSKTDKVKSLQSKLEKTNEKLPKSLQGKTKVIERDFDVQ